MTSATHDPVLLARAGARFDAVPARRDGPVFYFLAALVLTFQLCLSTWNIAAPLTVGHNGYNTAAYLQAARNSLRFDTLVPYQVHNAPTPPPPSAAYTHAPLAAHLHSVAAVWALGEHPYAVRAVPALHAVLVVLALLVVTRAHWSSAHALIAAATYTLLPINAIYLNMFNHSTGFQLWSILLLHCYLRLRAAGEQRWLWGMLICTFMALQWDWPAYYLVSGLCLHMALSAFATGRRGDRAALVRYARWIGLVSALLGLALWGQWLLGRAGAGNEELTETFVSRQSIEAEDFARTLRSVPKLVFGWPVLAISALWLLDAAWRTVRGRALGRDLMPLLFAFCAVAHLMIFKKSAWQHEYWLWPALPAVAWALADVSVRGARRAWGAWQGSSAAWAGPLRAVLVGCMAAPILALALHSAAVVPHARQTGGSLWFIGDVRGDNPQTYRSARSELDLAARVHDWTTGSTGVLRHPSLDRYMLEPSFEITLDRLVRRLGPGPLWAPSAEGVDGWVVLGARDGLSSAALLELAGPYALTLYDRYFMVDLRRADRSVRVLRLATVAPTWAFRFFESSFELPVRALRDPRRERELRAQREAQSALLPAHSGVDAAGFARLEPVSKP